MYDFCFVCAVLNRKNDIVRYVNSMLNQSYDRNKYIVVVVDNGSDDGTLELLNKFKNEKNFIVLDGSNVKGSPYSARNLIIKNYTAKNYCFMDGYPDSSYLENASNLELEKSLVAGEIIIEVNEKSSTYELYDSIFNLDNEKIVSKFNRAPTGNLIVNQMVFDSLGHFNENIRSGGDMIYTSKAVKEGFRLEFNPSLRSYYFSRNKEQLIKKQKRVALGQVGIWISEQKEWKYFIKSIIKMVLPNNIITTYQYIEKRSSITLRKRQVFKLIILNENLRILMAYHNIKNFLLKISNNEK
ncbi:hypothetical protein CWO08_08390 [Vibrio sp. 10N.286.48.B8]|uniref:glycosyltransferase n=1 Tax=Vibrio sp. 10N.286.48.B8 TaxID=2056189 RepID=UPI000D362EA9|nr:glycosyltransferase [Vibrio sp. 10N.286.48.B8]PTO96260.1 hypothetical protein CWO08_08390 [Vibrio sp. 10N.286.48.B8]